MYLLSAAIVYELAFRCLLYFAGIKLLPICYLLMALTYLGLCQCERVDQIGKEHGTKKPAVTANASEMGVGTLVWTENLGRITMQRKAGVKRKLGSRSNQFVKCRSLNWKLHGTRISIGRLGAHWTNLTIFLAWATWGRYLRSSPKADHMMSIHVKTLPARLVFSRGLLGPSPCNIFENVWTSMYVC